MDSNAKESKLLKCACNFTLVNDFQRLYTSNLGDFVKHFMAVEDKFYQFINWNYIRSCKTSDKAPGRALGSS